VALSESQKWFILALTLFTGLCMYLLAPVLTPFLVSMLLAYLGDPLVDRLAATRLNRTLAVVVVFALMLLFGVACVLVLLPALERQVVLLIGKIPQAIEWAERSLLPRFSALYGAEGAAIDVDAIKGALMQNWQEIGSVAGRLLSYVSRSGQLIIGWLTYLLLVPVVTFYLLRDWDILVGHVHDLLPRRVAPRVAGLAREIDAILAEFLRGQLTVMAALATVYTCGLWLVGLELAFVVGMLAGVVSFVPYLGVIVGIAVAGFAAVMQFNDLIHVLGVVAVFGAGQLLEGMILSPLLVGDRIGLHPVAVIFAVLAGGQLFGFFGVLLALPVAAVVVVLLRHSRDEYKSSDLYTS
jgi:predicted PurR-regulated permease PerM